MNELMNVRKQASKQAGRQAGRQACSNLCSHPPAHHCSPTENDNTLTCPLSLSLSLSSLYISPLSISLSFSPPLSHHSPPSCPSHHTPKPAAMCSLMLLQIPLDSPMPI